jgi:thioredoxin-dependent peroxiredoxin
MLKPGDAAFEFVATDCRNQSVTLRQFRGRRVVLFFFPKAFSPACTLEIRYFKGRYEDIVAHDAELIGVSVDKRDENCRFALKEDLQFRLLGDEERHISRGYGVLWPLLNVDRRATFVIGPDGVIEDVFHHEVRVGKHLDDVLQRLRLARSVPLA